MYNIEIPQTRKETIHLLKVFNRGIFEKEYYQVKATNMLTKNILKDLKNLELTEEEKTFLKTEEFKDELFLLLKQDLNTDQLKPLTNIKINENYINSLEYIKIALLKSLIGDSDYNYTSIINILVNFIEIYENKNLENLI